MKMISLLLLTACFFSISSCALGPQRELGSCVLSSAHGGPYVVTESTSKGLILRDPVRKTGELGPFKNDETWEAITCPF